MKKMIALVVVAAVIAGAVYSTIVAAVLIAICVLALAALVSFRRSARRPRGTIRVKERSMLSSRRPPPSYISR